MPPQRTPLRPISGNTRVLGSELSTYERGLILGAWVTGLSPREIKLHMNYSKGAVRNAIALHILNTNGNSLPRPGRPRLYNDRDCRIILRNLRQHPKLNF